MSLEHFRIHFGDRPNRKFFCGETVSGHIALKLKKAIRLRGLEIKFTGKAEVAWRETTYNAFWGTTTTTYAACEYYVNHSNFALGGKDDDITLPPGEYTYNFSLKLPQESPSSFESKYGHVRYKVKAKIDRPWKSNYEVKEAFTVINVMDLNSLDSVQKVVYICTPDDTCFPSEKEKTKEKYIDVATEELGAVSIMASENFQSSMVIPPLPASFLNPCKCIDVTYILRFVGDIQGFHLSAILDVPIVIGTIPLRNHFQSIPSTDMQVPSSPAATEDCTNPSAQPGSNYPELPPPSFEECAFGATDLAK